MHASSPPPAPPTETVDDAETETETYSCQWCHERFTSEQYDHPLQTYASHCKNCSERPSESAGSGGDVPTGAVTAISALGSAFRSALSSSSRLRLPSSKRGDSEGPVSHRQRMRLLATAEATHPDDLPDEVFRSDFAVAAVIAGFLVGTLAAHDATIETAMVNAMMVLFGAERAGRYISRIPERWLSYLRDNVYEAAAGASIGIASIQLWHYHTENPEQSPIPIMLDVALSLPLPL